MADSQKYSTHIQQHNQTQFPTMIHNQMHTMKQPNDINTQKTATEKNPYTKFSKIFLLLPPTGTYTIPKPQNLKHNIVYIVILLQVTLITFKFGYLTSFSPPLITNGWLIQIQPPLFQIVPLKCQNLHA